VKVLFAITLHSFKWGDSYFKEVGGNKNIRIMEGEKGKNKQGIQTGWITSFYS
jgi:hypothetical protein